MTDRWNIIGHDWAADLLREQIARQSLHHAYLFAGPPGVGRRTLALRFAQALNCSNPPQPGIPCGVCWDCVQLMKGEHPDLVELEAQPKEGTPPAIDRLGNRRSGLTLEAEPVRDSRLLLSLKPYRAAYRVAIYRYFEEASLQAANALLKTLEETPASSIMILTADSVEAMLPTVASRCEVLRLQPVPAPVLAAWLQGQGAEQERARLIASISGGRPAYALRLLQRSEAFSYRQTKLDELQSLLPATRAQKFAYADRLAKDKNAMRGVLMLWLSMWRDVLWRASGASTPIANVDRQADIDRMTEHVDFARARGVVSELDRALERLDANVNARLLAEVLLLDWPSLPQGKGS